MPTVSGPLSVVTEGAAVVTAMWVQAPALRPHGEGAILPQRARATIDAGAVVSFPCAPGPAVLIWQAGGVEDQVPILVSEEPDQSLASVVRAARLSSGRTADELAALVREVTSGVAAVTAAASSASWSGDRLTVLGATSPPLTGPRGLRGLQGPQGERGPEGPQGERGPEGGPHIMEGRGQPQGVVAAPPGTLYLDLDRTAGATLWLKETGNQRYGWVVLYGSIRNRNLNSLLPEGVQGTLRISRHGGISTLTYFGEFFPDGTGVTIPSEFASAQAAAAAVYRTNSDGTALDLVGTTTAIMFGVELSIVRDDEKFQEGDQVIFAMTYPARTSPAVWKLA